MREEFINSEQWRADIVDELKNDSSRAQRELAHVHMVDRLRLLWNRRLFLLRLAIVGLVIATLLAFLIPAQFESTSRLMPPDQTNSGMALLSAAIGGKTGGGSSAGSNIGSIAGDLFGIKTSGDLFMGMLQSRTVEDAIIAKFDLRKVYRDRYQKDARIDLKDKTDISADRKSGIIKITVTDRNPKRAAAMAQGYVEELNRLVSQVNTTSAHRERVFLEGRLNEVMQGLESAERNFSEFASKNAALDIPTQGKAMIESAAALKGQLIVAQTELQGMRQIYTDSNVRVRGIQARVDELQRQLQQFGGKFDSAEPNGQNTDTMFPSIRKLPTLGVSYADLFRNMKVQEAVFETLTQEYELAKVQEAKETPSVKIIDPAEVPEKHSYPPRLWIILGGTCFFLLLGIAWILGGERWERLDPKDPGKVFALEIATALKLHWPSTVSSNGNGAKRGS